jgi:DNA-binding beta-propeller fold protein YncE
VALVTSLAALGIGASTQPEVAEPATSPALTTAPAGRIVPVGEQAEGIIADPGTHLVAVGVRDPDGLALLDGRTGAVKVRIPLPGHLRHLDLAAPGRPVLVADEDSGNLITVSLPGGAILATVSVGRYPHPATVTGDGTFAVTGELGGTFAVTGEQGGPFAVASELGGPFAVAGELGGAFVLVRDGRVVHRCTGATQPGGIAAVGDRVGVVDVRDRTLSLHDAHRETRIGRLAAGDGPTHLIADKRGHLLVVDTGGDRILTFEITPRLRQIGSTPLPGTPYGVAYDGARDRLWVTLTARNQVAGLDLTIGTPTVVATIPTVRQPNTVAVDPATGRIFVASRADGSVQLVDPPA